MEHIWNLLVGWWPGIETFLKIVPGVILLPLSAVLAFRKLSYRAEIFYTWQWSIDSVEHICWMLIRNLKEKPLEVFAIHALIDNDLRVEIFRSKSPLIIKSMECAELNLEKVSYYDVYGYSVSNIGLKDITDFYITTADKVITAKGAPLPEALEMRYFGGDTRVMKPIRNVYKGRPFTCSAAFAVDYRYHGEERVSIVLTNGAMTGDLPLRQFVLTAEDVADAEIIRDIVMDNFPDGEITNLTVTPLRHSWQEQLYAMAEAKTH